MDKNRLSVFGLVSAIVLIALGGWFFGISPLLDQAADAQLQRSALLVANNSNQSRVAVLQSEFAGIESLRSRLSSLASSVPANPEMPVFLREINAETIAAQVLLGTVTIGDAQTFQPPVGRAPGPAPVPPTSGALPAPAYARLVQIPLSISVTGSSANLLAFVGGMQAGSRLYFVNNVVVVANNGVAAQTAEIYTATVSGFVYVLPLRA